MAQVHLLDAKISNMIAAGEVIERPAAVVKELVENSIDAKSTRIEISIRDGGTSCIEVIDNGTGMSKEDALLSFERHATSKISSEMDLWNIQTLGFRGEALPSIASVSEVTMTTCNEKEATQIRIEQANLVHVGTGTMRKGTQIKVEQLFYTLPARLKHLKSVAYETSLIVDVVNKLALVNPHIAFALTSDDKELFRTSGNKDMQAIIYAIYGRDVAKAAILVGAENDEFRMEGYVCLPHMNRANRYHIVTFINDRMVKSYKLQQAIVDAYRDVMAPQRYPMAFIRLYLDHKLIDVNVHPSKWEVRLAKEQELYAFVTKSIEEAIRSSMHRSSTLLGEDRSNAVPRPMKEGNPLASQMSFPAAKPWARVEIAPAHIVSLPHDVRVDSLDEAEESEIRQNVENVKNYGDNTAVFGENLHKIVDNVAENVENYGFFTMTVIGQLHGSYVLCQDEHGLVIVDQHAANERIRYEEIRAQLMERSFVMQPLLFPLVISINQAMMQRWEEIAPVMQSIGLELEVFGEREVVLREVPSWLVGGQEEQLIYDILEYVMDQRMFDLASLNKDILATMACHTSVRFNRSMTMAEMNELVKRLWQCENPHHCPHGRPTMITMEASGLRKRFDRS